MEHLSITMTEKELRVELEKKVIATILMSENAVYDEDNLRYCIRIYKHHFEFILTQKEKGINNIPSVVSDANEFASRKGSNFELEVSDLAMIDVNLDKTILKLLEISIVDDIKKVSKDVYLQSNDLLADPFELIENLETNLEKIKSNIPISDNEKNVETYRRVLEDLNDYFVSENDSFGIPSGYDDIDKTIKGFQKSKLYILAARPAMGKTALALNMFKNIFSQKKRALFYSLEMSKEELFRRLIAQEVEIDLNNKSEIDFSKIMVKTAFLNDDNFIIEDKVFDLNSILMNAKRHNLHEKIDFVVIDYLQIINNSKSNRNRESEVSEISRKLKLLAKELDCPVLCLSQLSRSVESRADKRPLLSDLRDSGAIEQDADVVMFVYRPSYYGFKEDADGNPIPEHLTIISIAKNRAGSLKDVKLSFIGKYTKFYNYDDFGGGFGSQPTPYQSNSSMQPNSSFLSNNETNETPNYDRQIESKRDDDDDVPF